MIELMNMIQPYSQNKPQSFIRNVAKLRQISSVYVGPFLAAEGQVTMFKWTDTCVAHFQIFIENVRSSWKVSCLQLMCNLQFRNFSCYMHTHRRRARAIRKGPDAFETVLILGQSPRAGCCKRWKVVLSLSIGFFSGAVVILTYLLHFQWLEIQGPHHLAA